MPSSPASEDPGSVGGPGAAEGPPASLPEQQQPPADGQAAAGRQAAGNGLQAELEQAQDRHKRAVADLDNYRKRSARETDQRIEQAQDAVIAQWLEVVDSVERAVRGTAPGTPLDEGLRAVLEQIDAVLVRLGLTRLGRPGEPFDPERHEAVGVVDTTDAPDRTILEVARSGYARGSRVLRPAQVIVARRPAPTA